MHATDIIIGLILVAILGGVYFALVHHKAAAGTPGKDLADTLSVAGQEAWDSIRRDLPELVSAEVAQLRADISAAVSRAEKAEADLAAEVKAGAARLEAVKAQVGAMISGISTQPASTLVASAVAATQAEDAAAVQAVAAQINPA